MFCCFMLQECYIVISLAMTEAPHVKKTNETRSNLGPEVYRHKYLSWV